MYEDEIKFLKNHEDSTNKTNHRRIKLSDDEIQQLKVEYVGIPEDFCHYLKEIGWGSFRECQYAIFEPIGYFENLYDVGIDFEEKRYLAFGHDFSGDTSVFDIEDNFAIKEFWHDSYEFNKVEKTFKAYIRECMLIDENGNDMREHA